MNNIVDLSCFRRRAEQFSPPSPELLLRRAKFALETRAYLDAAADALTIIVLREEQKADVAEWALAVMILLHAQSGMRKSPGLQGGRLPLPPFCKGQGDQLASLALLFALDTRNDSRTRCVLYLGLIRYYQDENRHESARESAVEVQNLCTELGEKGKEMLAELRTEWPSLA